MTKNDKAKLSRGQKYLILLEVQFDCNQMKTNADWLDQRANPANSIYLLSAIT